MQIEDIYITVDKEFICEFKKVKRRQLPKKKLK